MIVTFMFADIALLPKNLISEYAISRLGMQVPLCILFLAGTFHPLFLKNYQKALFLIMLAIVYANYWLIIISWQQAQFIFPYEGTLLYTLFTLFIFRQSFQYALFFTFLVVLGFSILSFHYLIYGDHSFINFGFVAMGSLIALIGVKQIETAFKKLSAANNNLEKLNEIDYLTDIYNRRTYESRFSELIALRQRTAFSLAVFIIDIDYFKDYNDGYGHIEGDKIIQLQANNLADVFRRNSDIIARYGGEEFVVVTTQVDQAQCITLANKIIEQWTSANITHNKGSAGTYVTCSIGFYLAGIDQEITKNQIVKYADDALYQAKRSGRNCFIEYKTSK
ncbi:GGDEF domain-containing protein [Psychromonas sp.]|nr:GGDEF domain-containing protein [Psychromonas sp.]